MATKKRLYMLLIRAAGEVCAEGQRDEFRLAEPGRHWQEVTC